MRIIYVRALTTDTYAQIRWMIPLLVLLLAGIVQYMFTADATMASEELYGDRLRYNTKMFPIVRSLLSFVSANRSNDPVMRYLTKLFTEERVVHAELHTNDTNSELLHYALTNPRDYNYRLLFGVVFRGNSEVGTHLSLCRRSRGKGS